jgi:small-conductance mechanosensitive channel
VLALATCNEEGQIDADKKRIARRLFRPDAGGQITELAFIQSCDAIFKRLCFFRASVGNSSVIDKVLGNIVDWFYYFTLTMMLLSLLRFNPWALMVSLTSLLVSASFALGSSLSRYVEGILLIAVTRPYDLGDRIYIGPADTVSMGAGSTVDVSSHTWFVEDITLTTTTLRFARTNEVSILHNSSIIGSKIINCNRSPGAIILMDISLHISIFEGQNLDGFVSALQKYVETHPRVWDSLVFCRHDAIDADNEKVAFA